MLKGIKVLELAGLAPAPYCGLLLSNFGANVFRIQKQLKFSDEFLDIGKSSIELNLKLEKHKQILLTLMNKSDVLIDPYRPGVLESLLLPKDTTLQNWLQLYYPKLIVARLTGYGQTGSYRNVPGHDINYLALSGVLSTLKRKHDKPLAPINYLADFAGGGLFCAYGIVLALYERKTSNKGQIIDMSMVEGVHHLASFMHQMQESFAWDKSTIGGNILDSGAPFYDTYECKIPQTYIAVGCIEPQFYQHFIKGLGLNIEDLPHQMDQSNWSILYDTFTSIIKTKTTQEWIQTFHQDACVSPVLSMDEANLNTFNTERNILIQHPNYKGKIARPTPLFSRTPGNIEYHNSSKLQPDEAIHYFSKL